MGSPSFEQVWQALRAVLMRELRWRGLWIAPPRFLGVFGYSRWTDEAVDELCLDCYQFVFVRRLPSLIARAKVSPDLVGVVRRSVRNFLHERQRAFDPLGYRVFSALRTGVQKAVSRGELFVLDGEPEVRNNTLLGFSTVASAAEASEEELAEIVRSWGDDLIPELVTASGRQWQVLEARLVGHLLALRDRGIESFRFRHLVDALKADVRARWAALFSQEVYTDSSEPGALHGSLVRFARPDLEFEGQQRFEKLVACVAARLGQAGGTPRMRQYLQSLWGFLRAYAADQADRSDSVPSNRQLAALLAIPRAQLGNLFETLGELLRACDREISRTAGDPSDTVPSQNDQRAS